MIKSVFGKGLMYRTYGSNSNKIYTFDQFKVLVQNPSSKVVLVDVREPSELLDYKLPHTINIPYKTKPEALSLSRSQFKAEMGFEKPAEDKELVFFCAKGIRAAAAKDIASKNGYSTTAVYPGSMTEWLANGGRDIK
ncbi:similar to Saccharomyces cerevisiae YOR286W RDL2 Protein with rhodanese activity [Maudiozyma barnettii]|uniref:Similar to Saccharomyces cerevisiae YOR286W RDL2 Protein with rhodanese activity n=1 Tax=Maudiozyma barnettii TaxID=61262 RepID=A0A8H2ZG33_9SACH|nr:thiosulfate sulfurtransferase RDL2 [Kazachstania barnettii]CAB4252919.1 similar to Saccharomyces cerevisiae YOR286W RDL2 Protein with rhodanese activity [Kazachstania barnettii]CAD1780714.1 similar to Saccharomyces cerevisiae YOR286W RDL2 Protein with rhodanese activity [Kazachstania barnettii]